MHGNTGCGGLARKLFFRELDKPIRKGYIYVNTQRLNIRGSQGIAFFLPARGAGNNRISTGKAAPSPSLDKAGVENCSWDCRRGPDGILWIQSLFFPWFCPFRAPSPGISSPSPSAKPSWEIHPKSHCQFPSIPHQHWKSSS